MDYSVIIVAAGKGERFSKTTSKILYELPNGKRVIHQTIDAFMENVDVEIEEVEKLRNDLMCLEIKSEKIEQDEKFVKYMVDLKQ